MKRLFFIMLAPVLVFLPAALFAQTVRESAFTIIVTPITFEPALWEDSPAIYQSMISELGWQGLVNSYRLVETTGQLGAPPSLSSLPPAAQEANPRYVVTSNLYRDGPDRIMTLNLYNTTTFDLVGSQELEYRALEEVLALMAYFCWILSSNLPADNRPVDPDIFSAGPAEDMS